LGSYELIPGDSFLTSIWTVRRRGAAIKATIVLGKSIDSLVNNKLRALLTHLEPCFCGQSMFGAAQGRGIISHVPDRVQGASPGVAFERTPK
jgi:hypothetical protein